MGRIGESLRTGRGGGTACIGPESFRVGRGGGACEPRVNACCVDSNIDE